jgi:predicted DNA-binding mobile mystery protein A
MRVGRKTKNNQLKIIEKKLAHFQKLNEPIPPSGWIKAIRGALGLSIRQLAERVGVSHGSINQLEKREAMRKVTLESLDQAARAMDCKVVYAVVPANNSDTLDEILRRHAIEAATQILKEVSHSMRMEGQGTSVRQLNDEIQRIATDLIESGDARIWVSKTSNQKGKK